jgi:hypothetical protein
MFVASSVSRFVSLVLAFAFSWAGPARAGSFLMDTGGWQVITSTTMMTSNLAYDGNGALTPASAYRKIETGVLMEYGLSRDVTLVLSPVTRDISAEGQAGTITGRGLSSFEAGARWRLFDYDGQAVTFQATTRIPAKTDPVLLYENRPRTELRLGYGAPSIVSRRPGFIDASIAWVKRHEPGTDEVKIDMTYGWWQRRDRMVLLQYFTTIYPGAGWRRDPRQHKIQTSTVYKLNDEWSLQLGSFFTRGGYLTRRERGTIVAVWRRF